MTDPLRDDQDDRLDDLPPLGGSLGEDEELGTGEELDQLEVDLDTEGQAEDVGLDDSTAGADVYDIAELLGESATDDEGERWTEGTDEAGADMVSDDGLQGEGDEAEYGWTEDTEAPAAGGLEGWDEDLFDEPEEPIIGDDMGEEGVEEDYAAVLGAMHGDDDATALPPLDADLDAHAIEEGDELADDLDLQDEAEIEGMGLSFEEEARLSGAALPEPLPPAQLGVSYLGPEDDALCAVLPAGRTIYAAGERLYRLGGRALQALDPRGLEGHDLTSIAPDPGASGERLVVGTRLGGALRSNDGGASFSPVNSWHHDRDPDLQPVAFFVAAEPHDGGVRLWGRTRAGVLYRSDDFGDRWSSPLLPAPARALAVDPAGGVTALCVPRNGSARLGRTTDGGRGWTMHEVPGLEALPPASEVEHHVTTRGELVVVTREQDPAGPCLSRDGGQSFERLRGLPSAGPTALAVEDGAPVLYVALFFDGADRGVVVRQPLSPGAAPALVLDVRTERDERRIEARGDPEGDNRVLALTALAEGPRTRLYAATGAGLFRLDVRP